MAAKLARKSNVFASLCTNRGLYVSFCRRIRNAPIMLEKDDRSLAKSYCVSASLKTESEAVEKIYSAVCVERSPLITPDKTELMKRYEELQDQLELENSALSQDEVEVKRVNERKKKLTERDEDENLEIAKFEEQRKEFQEEQDEEFHEFQPAGRETDADRRNDLKSIHRRLKHTLVLLVKGKDSKWVLPYGLVEEKETLRQAAERLIKEACGMDINIKFISNSPAGVLKQTVNRLNNKVFFYKACFIEGAVQVTDEYEDYVWVTRDEMKEYLKLDYYKTVSRFTR